MRAVDSRQPSPYLDMPPDNPHRHAKRRLNLPKLFRLKVGAGIHQLDSKTSEPLRRIKVEVIKRDWVTAAWGLY